MVSEDFGIFFNTQAKFLAKQLFNKSLTLESTILLDVKIENFFFFLPSATWQVNTLTYLCFTQIPSHIYLEVVISGLF